VCIPAFLVGISPSAISLKLHYRELFSREEEFIFMKKNIYLREKKYFFS